MLERLFKYLIPAIAFFILGSCLTSVTVADEIERTHYHYIDRSDTITKIDTIHSTITTTDTLYDTLFIPEHNRYFSSYDDLVLFTIYLKTQSNQLDNDNWSCIHTLFNRMSYYKVGWREYFYSPSINNSRTIKRILRGDLEVDFSINRSNDRALLSRVLDAYWGYNPTNCPRNVLYFESHRKSPNNGVFLKSKIWKQYRHKFYYGKLNNEQ